MVAIVRVVSSPNLRFVITRLLLDVRPQTSWIVVSAKGERDLREMVSDEWFQSCHAITHESKVHLDYGPDRGEALSVSEVSILSHGFYCRDTDDGGDCCPVHFISAEFGVVIH